MVLNPRHICTVMISLTALACCVLAAGQDGNLLDNGRLQEGILSPTGWAFNAPEAARVVWQVSPDGGAAVLLEGAGRDWAGLSSGRVGVTAGEKLSVAATMRVLPGADATEADRLFVRFFRGGSFIGQAGPGLGAVGEGWQAVAGVVDAPDGADGADVSVQIRSNAKVQVGALCLMRGADAGGAAKLLPPASDATDWADVTEPRNLPADGNGNGLPDSLERFLGIAPEEGAVSTRRTRGLSTSLQTPTGYREDNDLKVDAVIVAGNAEEKIRSWAAMGYEPHVMVGFRAGPAYIDGHRDEVQTDRTGRLLTCGPGSYYMVPTENRRRIFRQYFYDAVKRGAKAACPEEPEFFSWAGHSEAFKQIWEERYGEAWVDQNSSVEARLKSERLKVELERELLQACWAGAREADPNVKRFLLAHSPLNYTQWGIVFGHHDALATGEVDAMVAQVWTGTARTPVNYKGSRAERTFENAYLEYASCVGLTRGADTELWFLMDPLEDNPDRTMEDYRSNYARSLAASLMFPEVDRFETMPWPTRIFGRVPEEFATVICSVINVLSDIQNQDGASLDAGTEGIGTFLSDSAMWQRGAPEPSDLDCFYGLTLPLLMRGIPVRVPHLDRAADAGYLDAYKLLLVSYDMLKPARAEINQALADWVRRGGCLAVFGGNDAYNEAPEWWRQMGFLSPQDHLLSLCGFDVSGRQVAAGAGQASGFEPVVSSDYAGRDLGNQTTVEIDLTPFLAEGAALVKFEDSISEDGWGPLITKIEFEGLREGARVREAIVPGTPEEAGLISADQGSAVNPEGFRFCDRHSFVVYRLEFDAGTAATAKIEVGNQYRISAAVGAAIPGRTFHAVGGGRAMGTDVLAPPISQDLVLYRDSEAKDLYASPMGAVVQEKAFGEGSVIFCGISPSWFASSGPAADAIRALVRYAVETKLGGGYSEQGYVTMWRGKYLIARAIEGGVALEGQFVDVLQADLPVVERVELAPGDLAVLYDAHEDMTGAPGLVFASSCVEWQSEEPDRTRLIVSGARGVTGTCRLYSGGRKVKSVRAVSAKGDEARVRVEPAGETLLLRYDNEPSGLAVNLEWGAVE